MAAPLARIRMPVSLRSLFPDAEFHSGPEIASCDPWVVHDVTCDSREVGPGMAFAVLPGSNVDGRSFVSDATDAGADLLLTDERLSESSLPQCVVADVRSAYAKLCAGVMGDPASRLKLAAVTGTNGKTTTTWMLRSALESLGVRCGLLGTIEYSDGIQHQPASLTTPDPKTLSGWLASMEWTGCTHAVLEASSHALDQGRLDGAPLDAAVVTNITGDHLDYHKQFDAYVAAKAKIASRLKRGGRLILGIDDPAAAELVTTFGTTHSPLTFGLGSGADVRADLLEQTAVGSRMRVETPHESFTLSLAMPGGHNVQNLLACVAVLESLGLRASDAISGLEAIAGVPGRLQPVRCGQPFDCFVDYAHTPDALQKVLGSLRPLTRGRLICVAGAGGDRDRTKRGPLGAAASLADLVILTSDNPRSEDPRRILEDVASGVTHQNYVAVEDRAEAIGEALHAARAGDVVVIAGKGHETTQEVAGLRIPFDDRDIAAAILSSEFALARCA